MTAYKTPRAIREALEFIVLMLLAAIGLSCSLAAKPWAPSTVALTRSASVIALVEIREIRDGLILAKMREAIKGPDIPEDMNIIWNFPGTFEAPVTRHEIGERVIIFANKKDNHFELSFEDSGMVSELQLRTTSDSLHGYKHAIEEVMRYDAASLLEKGRVLAGMLNDNYFSQKSAIEIIYFEKPRNYPTEDLVRPLTVLAYDEGTTLAVSAAQALGAIASKASIPTFIGLLDSKNAYMRETAFNILKDKTRADLTFDPRGAEQQRAEDIRKWSQWWQENQDRVQLHY